MKKSFVKFIALALALIMVLGAAPVSAASKTIEGAGSLLSDLFGCAETSRMIRAGGNVMSVILAALSCFFVFITVSTGILLAFCRS